MISAQIDELRKLAGDGSMEWVAGPVRASVLREAADTIWQLRDDLQRTNDAVRDAEHDESRAWDRVRKAEAENASLRGAAQGLGELCDQLKAENANLRTQLTDVTESMGRVEERCAKLRELAERVWKSAERLCQAFEGPCRDDGVTIYKPCPMGKRDEECVYGLLQRDLRDLGVEVDG